VFFYEIIKEFGLVEESVEENVKNSLQQIRNRPANKRNVFGFSKNLIDFFIEHNT